MPIRALTGATIENTNYNESVFNTRMKDLCQLWGLIKYSHPFLTHSKIDWDGALIDAISKFLEVEEISGVYSNQVLNAMISELHDPNTYIENDTTEEFEVPQETEGQTIAVQPYVDTTASNVAVITMTDYDQFTRNKAEMLENSFQSAITSCKAVVFDVRCRNPNPSHTSIFTFSYLFERTFSVFLREDLDLPTSRQRVFNGLPDHKRWYGQVFYHGMLTMDGEVLHANSNQPHQASIVPMVFVVDDKTPFRIMKIVIGLQSAGLCKILYHVEEKNIIRENNNILVKEPCINSTIIQLSNCTVYVRQNETVNPDGSIGFHPNLIYGGRNRRDDYLSLFKISDNAVINSAISLVLQTGRGSQLGFSTAQYVRHVTEKGYQELLPSVEYRLLSFFRLWNAIHYFYVYKDSVTIDWNELFNKYLLIFRNADSPLDYALTVAKLVNSIKDNSNVRSPSILSYIGTHIPPIQLKNIDGNFIVARLFEKEGEEELDIELGDIILEIDDVNVNERKENLFFISPGSTEQAIDYWISKWLLAGEQFSPCKIKIRRGEEILEIELVRVAEPKDLRKSTGFGPYKTLEELDVNGGQIGFVDLTVLSHSEKEINESLNCMKSSSSLIIDLRGYTKGAIYRLAPYLIDEPVTVSQRITPFIMPSSLGDNLEPNYHINKHIILPALPKRIFSGKMIVLIDNETIGYGEESCLYIKACYPDAIFIGTKTNGSVGNLTNIILPGSILVGFSGMGYSDHSGELIQGKGFVPNITVDITPQDIGDDRDILLETAIEHLQK
eukprot:TRINITY_DN3211_c0_g1_i2.p1 TRINITY_DN3211_c0_g1~~TRINITY_DN3211_c0_g1_i2.p1  ORF type:complete len:783 (-),score=164.02 TRINITY_DN3211_c0_g1_i2:8-2356(-)